MSIPPRFLDELRSRLALSDIVGRKVRLQNAGREYKACCPFHNEKTPSFYVNDDKQFYHCFGCGAHGDIVGFVMQHDNLSFIEAIEMLAAEAGLEVPQQSPQEIEKAKQEKSLYTLMEDATKWMEAQLREPANESAYRYITERGISEDQLSAFRIGYAPADRQAMRNFLKAQGYSDAQMIEAGVLRPAGKSGEPYAFFRERIMFPVPDRRGRVVAFGGRILPDHLRPPDHGDYVPAKYMNSSDTPLFHKGKMLYGEPHARQAAADGKPIVVVEGYLDVIAGFKAGYRGAVAPLGTALTEEQILVLWKMIPDDSKIPVLCFDGDEAGRRAAAKAADRILPLLKPNHSARIAFLPEGQDPDSLTQAQGPKALAAVIEGAMPLVDFLWQVHTQGKRFDTPEARAGLSKKLEEEALRIPDRDVQHYYRQGFRDKIRQAFGGGYDKRGGKGGFGQNFKGWVNGWKGQKGPNESVIPLKSPGFSRQGVIEQALLATILNHPELFDDIEEQLGSLEMSQKGLDRVRQAVLSTLSHNAGLDAENLRTYLIEQGFEGELKGILSESVYTHARFARPQTEYEVVKAGWDAAWDALHQDSSMQELKAAGAALVDDLNEDNENRMMALRNLHKSSKG